MQNPQVLWRPNPGPQARFLACSADEALYGGAAGGGKSAASIALPLRWVHNPRFSCLFLRRESKYLRDAIQKSDALYPKFGAKRNQSTNTWTFPSGAQVWLNHVEHENDIANYDSLEFALVIWEELTHFTEKQYDGVNARIRGTDPTLPYWSRATCNPGGPGHEWVFKRFGAWLNPKASHHAGPGEVLAYLGDAPAPIGTPDALTRTFIPAKLADNPHVDPKYRARLLQLDPVRRAQLLGGDWLARAARKDYYDRALVRTLRTRAEAGAIVALCRAWDFGATEDGDYTVGVLGAWTAAGIFVVLHVVRFQGKPDEVHRQFAKWSARDKRDDPRTVQCIPEDPGSAGKFVVDDFQRRYPGIPIEAKRPSGDKPTRFRGASSRALAGNFARVADGSWDVDAYDAELEGFPLDAHDDQVDATSDAYAVAAEGPGHDGEVQDDWMDR